MTTLVQLAMLFGALVGLGVFLVVRGSVPAPPALELRARLAAPDDASARPPAADHGPLALSGPRLGAEATASPTCG